MLPQVGAMIERGNVSHAAGGISAPSRLFELVGTADGCTLADLGLPCGGELSFLDCTVDRRFNKDRLGLLLVCGSAELDPQFPLGRSSSQNLPYCRRLWSSNLDSTNCLDGSGILLGRRVDIPEFRICRVLLACPPSGGRLTYHLPDCIGHRLFAGHGLVRATSDVESFGHEQLGT